MTPRALPKRRLALIAAGAALFTSVLRADDPADAPFDPFAGKAIDSSIPDDLLALPPAKSSETRKTSNTKLAAAPDDVEPPTVFVSDDPSAPTPKLAPVPATIKPAEQPITSRRLPPGRTSLAPAAIAPASAPAPASIPSKEPLSKEPPSKEPPSKEPLPRVMTPPATSRASQLPAALIAPPSARLPSYRTPHPPAANPSAAPGADSSATEPSASAPTLGADGQAAPANSGELGLTGPRLPVNLPKVRPPTEAPKAKAVVSAAPPVRAARGRVEPAQFHGVQPGRTTTAEVVKAWGQPKVMRYDQQLTHYEYQVEPFERVLVSFYKDKVQSLAIHLKQQFNVDLVAEQLNLLTVTPTLIFDDRGGQLGLTYPERGVVFSFAKGSDQVSQVILEAVDPKSFVLRAQERFTTDFTACLADVSQALELDPKLDQAHWLRARVNLALGRYTDADADLNEAVKLRTDLPPEYLVERALLMSKQGRYAGAMADAKAALALCKNRPDVAARANLALGDIVSTGPQRDYRQAIQYHQQAIKLAQSAAGNQQSPAARDAYDVLVEAHLAVAQDVAWGVYKEKGTVVKAWLDRAEKLASATSDPGLKRQHQLRLCQTGLAVCVGLQGKDDPTVWAQRTLEAGRSAVDETTDPLRKQQLSWMLGLGLYDALQAFHMRGEYGPALEYGGMAVTYFQSAMTNRQEAPGDAYLLGRLYFRIGSIYAVQNLQHADAVAWFDKAAPLIEKPMPVSGLSDVGRQGESLVSMAVSYWETGNQKRAVELTSRGLQLMEQAVKDGIMPEASLAVPYGNLANMHSQLGDESQAKSYADMAARIEGTKR